MNLRFKHVHFNTVRLARCGFLELSDRCLPPAPKAGAGLDIMNQVVMLWNLTLMKHRAHHVLPPSALSNRGTAMICPGGPTSLRRGISAVYE